MKATLESAPSAGAPVDEDSADNAFGTAFGPAAAGLLRRLERTAVSPFGLQPRVRFSIGERAETNGRMIFLPLESLDASECGDASVQSGAFDACRKDPAKQDGNSAARAAYLRASGLHEAFHVRYSDFRVFSQIARFSPQALRLANIFEDVRVDRLGLALHPEYHLARAADLQRLAFHGRGVFAEGAGDAFWRLQRLILLEAYEAGFFMKFPLTSHRRARAALGASLGADALWAVIRAVREAPYADPARLSDPAFAVEALGALLESLRSEARRLAARVRLHSNATQTEKAQLAVLGELLDRISEDASEAS